MAVLAGVRRGGGGGSGGPRPGEPMHVAAVRSILRKIDLDEHALQCAGDWPYHQPTADAMRARGEAPGPIHDNCSGKHAGMLALARLHGWEHAAYRRLAQPGPPGPPRAPPAAAPPPPT